MSLIGIVVGLFGFGLLCLVNNKPDPPTQNEVIGCAAIMVVAVILICIP